MDHLRNDSGSVLIMAIIAMLIMGILGVSFALLASVETRIGINYKHQGQAEALAEAGLERGRDAVRGAVATNAFTGLPSVLLATEALAGGVYAVRIDNNCPPLVPAAIQDPNCAIPGSENTDSDVTAVLTAWATSSSTAAVGGGRARVRAIVSIDDPWRHVCSNASQDNPPGYCNEPGNQNGNPNISPADPNDPNGPAVYDDLPRPVLGCSRIDPELHKAATQAAGVNTTACAATTPANGMHAYPYPAHQTSTNATGPRFVVMGQDPDVAVPVGQPTPKHCNGGGQKYFGYFDCALATPNPANGVRACVRHDILQPVAERDTRVLSDPTLYREVGPGCNLPFPTSLTGDQSPATGNVYGPGTQSTNTTLPSIGSNAAQYTFYFLNADVQIQSDTVYGTLVVEGGGTPTTPSPPPGCSGPEKDVQHKNGAVVWTGPSTGGAGSQYGYPLAYLIYDPELAPPTILPDYHPQNTCADMGSAAGTEIHGIIYSGGSVQVNPIVVDGGVIAFEIQTQAGSSVYGYNTTYGNAAPPPGFPVGSGNLVVISKKTFIACANYNDEAAGATACR